MRRVDEKIASHIRDHAGAQFDLNHRLKISSVELN